ncbi:MAG: hypothetical protein AMXMBFR34_49190 [Myxococcaceae bacterium]
MTRKRIGELLVERRAITQVQLEAGLEAQKRTRQRLGITLIQQGVITEVMLAQVLGQSLGLSTVDLTQVQVDWSAVHMLRARFCEAHELFPFAVEGKGTPNKRVMLALSDPLNQNALEEIEFTTGLKVAPYVSTHSQIRTAILRYYHKVSDAEAKARAPVTATGSVRLEPAEDEPPMVVGEEIVSASNPLPPGTPDPSLEKLIKERQSQAQAKKKAGGGVAKDLDFLFGGGGTEDEGVEKLERKFWALMRIMARKGLITREEFLKEVDGEE